MPYYFILEKLKQKQPFLVQRLKWVAGWLWRQYKQLNDWWGLNCSVPKLFELEDNGLVPLLIIFYQRNLQRRLLWNPRFIRVAGWLRGFLQVEQAKQAFFGMAPVF